MRLLLLDDLITSYTNARPEAGVLVVVDLDLGTRIPAVCGPVKDFLSVFV